MTYPVDMPTVEVTVGPVRHLETSNDLQFRVTFEAVHPSGQEFPGLIWVDSSERFMAITQQERSSGENMSLVLPATNAEGWKNFEGAPIDTDGGTLHTHAYQVRLAVNRSGMHISSFTIDKVFLPEGVSPVDLDDLISVPQEPGTPIDFPDVWGALVQQAEAAALAAQQAAQDAESAAELVRDNSIVDASLAGQDLVFEKHDLSTINVGRVAGLSAYEVAVAGGFVGTEADWLASLGSTVPGPPNTLTIGTVTEGDTAAASITGTAPNQVLDLTLKTGDAGPPTSIEIGDVETLPPGAEAFLRMRGTAPNLILDAGLVSGADGSGGGDSQIYRHDVPEEDLGEGWQAGLYFIRAGNIVTAGGIFLGAEGVARSTITGKIPHGYLPIGSALNSAFLIDTESGAITATAIVAVSDTAQLRFVIDENPAGLYYMTAVAYVTLDDPPESDAM